MGTLAQIVSVCKAWTLRALGRQSDYYYARASMLIEELAAAVWGLDAAEAAAALQAAACTQSLDNAAAVLLQVVHKQPCDFAIVVAEGPHIVRMLLDAAFSSSSTSFATAAADVLLLLTAEHSGPAGKAAAPQPRADAAAAWAIYKLSGSISGSAVMPAATAQLLKLLCNHVQLLLDAVACSQPGRSAAATLLLRIAAAIPNEAMAVQLLQLVAQQHESAAQPPAAAALAGTTACGAEALCSCANPLHKGKHPIDIDKEHSTQAAQACDAACAARSTVLTAALKALEAAAYCCPDTVSSALQQSPQGLQALLQLVCSGSDDISSSCCNSCSNCARMASVSLSVLQAAIGSMCRQQYWVLAELAKEKRLQLLLQALLSCSSCAADLLSSVSQTPEVQHKLLPSVKLLLGVVCDPHTPLKVRTAAATTVYNIERSKEGRMAVAEALQQQGSKGAAGQQQQGSKAAAARQLCSVGPLVQLLQQQGSSEALAAVVAQVLERASATPQGELLLLPYAEELAEIALQRHEARDDSTTVDEIAVGLAVWVCRLAGIDGDDEFEHHAAVAAASGAAEKVLPIVLDLFQQQQDPQQLLNQFQQQQQDPLGAVEQQQRWPGTVVSATDALCWLVCTKAGQQLLLREILLACSAWCCSYCG
jgi:hypothetical protein